MSIELVSRPSPDRKLSLWSDLPNVDHVSDRLSEEDRSFFSAVGAHLAQTNQTARLGIILLHSHFEMGSDEVLLERFLRGDRDVIVTSVHDIDDIESDASFVPRSWMFDEHPLSDDVARVHVLTWAHRDDLEQRPLEGEDSRLMRDLGEIFRQFNATRRFGMTLADHPPAGGKIWTEGEDVERRELVQQQVPLEEVQARNPLITVWNFDAEGRSYSGRKCCLPLPAGGGHSGRKHPGG